MSFTSQSFQWIPPVLQASTPFVLNSNAVISSYIIPAGYNCVSGGPVTVASGQVVTVSTGSRWVVV